MQISKISASQNFGYKLTPNFIEGFSRYPKLIENLQNEGNDKVTIDFHTRESAAGRSFAVRMDVDTCDGQKPYIVDEINDLTLKNFRELEHEVISCYLTKCKKDGTMMEKVQILLENFPHLGDYIKNYLQNL